jgi:hypothetical protein
VVQKQGTGPVGDNTAGITEQTGVPNPGTVAVISDLEGTTVGPGTQANTAAIISTVPKVTALILGSFLGGPEQTTATVATRVTPGSKPGTTSGTSPRVSTYLLQNFALLGVSGVAVIFFML